MPVTVPFEAEGALLNEIRFYLCKPLGVEKPPVLIMWSGGVHYMFQPEWVEGSRYPDSYLMELVETRSCMLGANIDAEYIEGFRVLSLLDQELLSKPCAPHLLVNGKHRKSYAGDYECPIEHWLKAKRRVFAGNQAFGGYLLQEALKADFDPSFSIEMVLDHGSLTPLELAGFDPDLPIVPILFNCVQPPIPTMRRYYQFGKFLGDAIRRYDGVKRVAILATGGISHDIATPRMGMVNREFDENLLQLLEAGDPDAVLNYATEQVHTAGNGAEEIRMWIAAMGAPNGLPFRRAYDRAVNDWYTGIGTVTSAKANWQLR
ncbi:hypothetical protein [Rhizobium sp. FKY42]|uniref:DODA-type extradiol aromatic ring-opening family dioxygenase n=1 Tax=Rhizobium sp. FKY42 TaxID=2562310 RepID=UPI001FEF990F|nr:hypothetical protein [Rhizobium sp. FKY42]